MKPLTLLPMAITAIFLAGCGSPGRNASLDEPSTRMVANEAPPAPKAETPGARPSSSHVWIPGQWLRENNEWSWRPGHWVVRPNADAVWIPSRWMKAGQSWRYEPGHWHTASASSRR